MRSFDDQWSLDVSREPTYTGRPRRAIPLDERGAVKQRFDPDVTPATTEALAQMRRDGLL